MSNARFEIKFADKKQLDDTGMDNINFMFSANKNTQLQPISQIASLSSNMQVIAITHLPQIATKGDAHFYVYKEDINESTITTVKKLSREERIEEVARMLSGAETTVQALENAKVMLKAYEK